MLFPPGPRPGWIDRLPKNPKDTTVESVSLLTAFFSAAAAAGLAAWLGFTNGRNQEAERGRASLEESENAAKLAIQELRDESQKKLDVMSKAAANDMEHAKQTYDDQIARQNDAHQTLVDSLKRGHAQETSRLDSEHSALIDRINNANNANMKALEEKRLNEIAEIKQERQQLMDTMRADHASSMEKLQQEHDRRVGELREQQAAEVSRLEKSIAALSIDKQSLEEKASDLEQEMGTLREQTKDAKLNNMFSVSRSGEKLIRVVRSVQELATELDETSRTVTGGDYSFFEQIKDQRDRETVLNLTGGGPGAYPGTKGDAIDPAEQAGDQDDSA